MVKIMGLAQLMLYLSVVVADISTVTLDDTQPSPKSGWGNLSKLILPNSAEDTYYETIGIFANATFLSYVATTGSYFNASYLNATISPGWLKTDLKVVIIL